MTAEDWKTVDKALKSVLLPGVKLLIDGYEVTLTLCQKSQFKSAIAIWINGSFKGKWLAEDCEERRRFLCCKKRTLVKEADYKAYGIRSKKAKKELADRYAYEEWFSYWTNFNKMKKHFIDNNKSIEILEVL